MAEYKLLRNNPILEESFNDLKQKIQDEVTRRSTNFSRDGFKIEYPSGGPFASEVAKDEVVRITKPINNLEILQEINDGISGLNSLVDTIQPNSRINEYVTEPSEKEVLLTDTKPYLFRQSPVVAEMLDDMLTGGTMAWNQQMIYGDFSAGTWWNASNATYTVANNILTITLTAVSGATQISHDAQRAPTIIGHKYLVWCSINPPKATKCRFQYSSIATGNPVMDVPANVWTKLHSVFACTGQNGVLLYYNTSGQLAVGDQVQFKNFCYFDLTQMFGSTIADYVYSLETQTAGSGIAWLKSFGFFTEDYYPYDAGTLLSVKTSAHETVKGGITHTYPLSDIELRGIPKLDASNNLYYDGDEYESSGAVTRKYGIVDLGTLTWGYVSNYTMFYAPISSMKTDPNKVGLCEKYCQVNAWVTSDIWMNNDKIFTFNGNDSNIRIKDTAYTDAATFKTAMSGVMLVYELITPTAETADPFTNPQQAGTTEEYIDTRAVPMPVGHVTEYYNVITHSIEDYVSILTDKLPQQGNYDTGCNASCMGLCYAGCYSACGNSCTGNCVGCSSQCSATCGGTCTGGCMSGCTATCGDACQGSCGNGCDSGCVSQCTDNCKGTCTGTCGGSCESSCGNDCKSGCTNSCSVYCGGDCKGKCTGGCTASCGDGCSGCSSSCSGGCYGCSGTCSGGCSGKCVNSCSGCQGCSGGCSSGCSSCGGGCSAACTRSCSAGCGSSCGTCYASCISKCTGNCYSGCQGGCSGNCNGCSGCGRSCSGACSTSCSSGCGGCQYGCGANCSGSCGSSCSNGCRNSCSAYCGSGNCKDMCSGGCTGGCGGYNCQGGCQGGCTNGCQTSCGGGCTEWCKNNCGNECSGVCTGTCKTDCTGNCSITCGSNCYAACSGNCYGNCNAQCTTSCFGCGATSMQAVSPYQIL